MKYPNLKEEKKLWQHGFKIVVGLDEAGRGPLAGPVVAAAISINLKVKNKNEKSKFQIKKFAGVKDSKQLSTQQREVLHQLITKDKNIEWGIGIVSEKVIDKINIKNAAELAMEKALAQMLKKLKKRPSSKCHDRGFLTKDEKKTFLIIDGNQLANPKLKNINHKLIIKGDQKVFSCAAASILAKVTRDRLMLKCHKKYPQYHFDRHKGYGTKLHLKMLKKHGSCPIHRKTFRPISSLKN